MRRYLTALMLIILFSGFQYSFAQAPEIIQQPASGIKCAGNSVSISITATGASPLSYQWYHDGVPVGTDNNVYEIASLQLSDEGSYYCEVSNGEGSIDSWEAQILVASGEPEITNAGALDTEVCLGETITLLGEANGDYINHVWYNSNDEYIGVGTNLNIANSTTDDEDSYYLVVENVCGSDVSEYVDIEIIIPAQISIEPVNQTVCEGDDALITLTATGENLSYKWLADGIEISGANTNELSIPSVTHPNNINYKGIVSNECHSDTSLGVSIIVKTYPEVTGQPLSQEVCAGEQIDLIANANSNSPQTYQWYENELPIFDATDNFYTTTAEAQVNNAYVCEITNMCGTVATDTAFIYGRIAPEITQQPLDSIICVGADASINCKANGDEPIYYQWLFNGADVNGDNISGEQSSTIIFSEAMQGQEGVYTCLAYNNCGETLTEEAYLTVNTPPSVLVQPENIIACEGNEIEYDLLISGTLPMEFEWINQTNSETLSTDEDLFISSAALENNGIYYCNISNECGDISTDLFEIIINQAPVAVSFPSDVSACEGDSIALIVDYEGTEPVDFLWYRNGSAVSWADNDTIIMNPANFGQTGTYFCRMNNECGTTDTDPFFLHIGTPPEITLNPFNQTYCEMDTLNLVISAAGENILYQWYHNETPLIGEADTVLNIPNIDVSYEGDYYCVAYNGCEDVYTDTVEVVINEAPLLDLGPDMDYCEGAEVVLSPEGDYQSYNWNNGLHVGAYLQVQLSGTYTLRVVGENGCSNYDTIQITFHPIHEFNFGNDTSVCGGMILDAGEGAYSYDWSNGESGSSINITSSGVYSLTTYGDEFGCEDSDTITVQVLQVPEIDLGDDINITIDSVVIVEADPIYEFYLWSNDFNGPSLSFSGAEYGAGDHEIWLQVTAYNGCTNSDTIVINVFDNSDIISIKDIEYLKLYPVPAKDNLWIEGSAFNSGNGQVYILNLKGQTIITENINQSGLFRKKIDTSQLSAGTYILKYISANNIVITKKFIIN
jgi:hypothetical protein